MTEQQLTEKQIKFQVRVDSLLAALADEFNVDKRDANKLARASRFGLDHLEELIADGSVDKIVRAACANLAREDLRRKLGPRTFQDLSDEEIMNRLRATSTKLHAFVESYSGLDSPVSALLIGPTGMCKSTAAFLVLRRYNEREETQGNVRRFGEGRWRGMFDPLLGPQSYCDMWATPSGPELRSPFKHGWVAAGELLRARQEHPLGQGEPSAIQNAKTWSLLVLDDILWPQRDEVTRDVLSARYDAGLPTIVTAGASEAELVARFGDAAVRRMAESAGVTGFVVGVGAAK